MARRRSRSRDRAEPADRPAYGADERTPAIEPTDRPEGRLPAPAARPAPATTVAARSPVTDRPRPERVRRRAYELYEERMRDGRPGDATSDWLQAERELPEAVSGGDDGRSAVEILAGVGDRPALEARTRPRLTDGGRGAG